MYGLHKEECEMAAKPKFKVGQRVRVVKDGHEYGGSCHGSETGDTATIVGIDDDGWCYTVGSYSYLQHEIEPIFSPGDRVRVTACNAYFAAGDKGVVEYTDTHHVFVKRGKYQRRGLPIETSKLEWLGSDEDCAERNEQQADKPEPEITNLRGAPTSQHTLSIKLDASDIRDALAFFPSGAPQPCIVALVKNGKPRPSQWPHVHADAASATAEAERLASTNPGQEFAVYQRVAGRKCEVSYEMKEVA